MDVCESAVVAVKLCEFDLSCQTRANIDAGAVADYEHVLREGGELPAVVAFRDSDGTLRLSSGFHRRLAYSRAGRETIPTVVRDGGSWEALSFGVRDNAKHVGVRLSRQDRREAATRLLRERPNASDRAIAELAGMSPSTVGSIRATVQLHSQAVRVGKDGRAVDVSAIGKSPSLASDEAPGVVAVMAPNDGPVVLEESGVGGLPDVPSDLQKRLGGLTPDQMATWRRFYRIQLQSGVDPQSAGWRALTETRRACPGMTVSSVMPTPEPTTEPVGVEVEPTGVESAKHQIGIWQDTVRRWMSGVPSIDRYRELYPGPLGDRVIDAAKELYEALGAWKRGINSATVEEPREESPERKRLPPKPRADFFRDLLNRLGTLKRVMGDTNKFFPNPRYGVAVRSADEVGRALVAWRDEPA